MAKLVERRWTGPGSYVDLLVDGSIWYRHNVVREADGDLERSRLRLRESFTDWGGEMFHFTAGEHEWITREYPQLNDPENDEQQKRAKWVEFGATSVGRQFRVDSKWRS